MVRIKPFHLLSRNRHWYVIDSEEMRAQSVDDDTAALLEPLSDETNPALPSDVVKRLAALDLITDEKQGIGKQCKKELPPIVNMALFLTQSCNLRCIYCYGNGGGYGSSGNLDERTAYRAVDWLIEQSGKNRKIHIGFFGGEPFLNFSMMKKVVEFARKRAGEENKTAAFHMTTNATLLDDEKIGFIEKFSIDTSVSFDGPKAIQDAQRPFADGRGSYDHTVPRIRKLLEKCPDSPAHAVIPASTDPGIVKKSLHEIGFTSMSILPASPSLFDKNAREISRARDLDHLLHHIEEDAETWIKSIKTRDLPGVVKLKHSSPLYHGLTCFLHHVKKRYPCGAGLGKVGVSCSGDIYLCHRFVGIDAYKLGTVFKTDLDREIYQQPPVTRVDECRRCIAGFYCAGGCKHDNAGANGSIFKPSRDMCRLKRREMEMAAYVVSLLDDGDRGFLGRGDIVPPKPCPLDFG